MGNIDLEITNRVLSGWKIQKGVSGILRDRRMHVRLKGKMYKNVVKTALMYRIRIFFTKKAQFNRMRVTRRDASLTSVPDECIGGVV